MTSYKWVNGHFNPVVLSIFLRKQTLSRLRDESNNLFNNKPRTGQKNSHVAICDKNVNQRRVMLFLYFFYWNIE